MTVWGNNQTMCVSVCESLSGWNKRLHLFLRHIFHITIFMKIFYTLYFLIYQTVSIPEEGVWPLTTNLKSVVYDSILKHFLSNSENISSRSTSFPFCVCAVKKQSGVHAKPWLCKKETNRVSRVEPPTQDVKHRRFSCVSTKHFV